MSYEEYARARDASWECLIGAKINCLPVKLSQICRHLNIRIIKNSNLNENKLLHAERGRAMYISGQHYIIVRDTELIEAQRYTIAHEIGHIYMGKSSEYEAERFAIDILAPACVLWGLNLHTAEEIATMCEISMASARIRAERMKVLYKRNKFLYSNLERMVYNQFLPFINANK